MKMHFLRVLLPCCLLILGGSTLAGLTIWQHLRMLEKQTQQTALAQLPPVELAGTLDHTRTALLLHQRHEGQAVWRVFTPLQTNATEIWLDRGTIPIPPDRLHIDWQAFAGPTQVSVTAIARVAPQGAGWLPSPQYNTDPRLWLKLPFTDYMQALTHTAAHITPGVSEASGLPAARHRGYRNTWATLFVVFVFWSGYVVRRYFART